MPDHEADGQDSRNRSRSPRRSRSRSPAPRKPKNYSGLKWKKSGRGGERDDTKEDQGRGYGGRSDRRDDGGRDRGYGRDRDQGRDRWDDRDRGKDRYNDRDRYRGDRDRGHDREHDRDRRPRSDRDRRDGDRDRRDNRDSDRRKPGEEKVKDKPEKRPAAGPPAAAATGERMITVTVNDRLGTKAQIPCLASDPVKLFKAMVAAKIGRPVHEIMLKRQGQRPFHDSLSLADYEISDGVQIDLELNTGD